MNIFNLLLINCNYLSYYDIGKEKIMKVIKKFVFFFYIWIGGMEFDDSVIFIWYGNSIF